MLAHLRNFLLYSVSLAPDISGVLWIDADVVQIPEELLRSIVDSDKDIVTARCLNPVGQEYDKNTWIGERKKPTPSEFKSLRIYQQRGIGTPFIPSRTESTLFLDDFANRKGPSPRFIKVDSVGGTLLYVAAKVHRSGINFPTLLLIGIQDWEMTEGYLTSISTF